MAKGEITVNEGACKGCGLCAHYCNRGVLAWPSEKLSKEGYLLPSIVAMDRCNACAICGWMCPDHAIEVFELVAS